MPAPDAFLDVPEERIAGAIKIPCWITGWTWSSRSREITVVRSIVGGVEGAVYTPILRRSLAGALANRSARVVPSASQSSGTSSM